MLLIYAKSSSIEKAVDANDSELLLIAHNTIFTKTINAKSCKR